MIGYLDKDKVEASTREFFTMIAPKLTPEQMDGFTKAAHYQALANEYMERAISQKLTPKNATA